MKFLGHRTAAETRGDDNAIERIAELTRLTERTVRSRLEAAHGKLLVRNLFDERWPSTPRVLGDFTVAYARRHRLHWEIASATGVTKMLVTRRLNATHGKKLVRNALWDCWPADEMAVRAGARRGDDLEFIDDDEDDDDDDLILDDEREPAASAEPAEPGPGTILSSRYELSRLLGRGGFGTTFEAHDRLTGLELVVKVPNVDDGGAVQRELRQAFRLLHPNICQAFPDRDDETGRPFLVLQHGGEDLAQRLERTAEPFPVSLAVHVLESLADALDYLHDRLVLHLDVTPSNVLLDEEDVVRLTDFGASSSAREHMGADGKQTLLATSVTALSRPYAAPEMFHHEGRSRSDQYSLALVFCSLLEGRAFRERYRHKSFPQLSDRQNAAIARALSQHPEDRFESCGEFARIVSGDLGRVPPKVMAADLDRLSRDLEHRFERELLRSDRGEARLGGVVLLGRGLERLLQATLLWMAAVDGFDAKDALQGVDARASDLARATAGALARTIMSRDQGGAAQQPEAETLVRDLRSEASTIWRLLNTRNRIVHGYDPATAVLPPARALASLVREHRRNAGW